MYSYRKNNTRRPVPKKASVNKSTPVQLINYYDVTFLLFINLSEADKLIQVIRNSSSYRMSSKLHLKFEKIDIYEVEDLLFNLTD